MKKILLSTLTIGALFASSCKKDNDIQTTEANSRLITSGEIDQPLPVLSPTVFFVDKDTLWTITSIADVNPIVSKKSSILNISISGSENENVFNFLPKFINQTPNIIYHPFLNRMLSINKNVLSMCYTPSRNTTTTILPYPNTNFGVPVRVNDKDNKMYYFAFGQDFPKTIRSINMDGTGDVKVSGFFGLENSKVDQSFNGDIDFDKNLLYFKDIFFSRIAIKNLSDEIAPNKTLIKLSPNETIQDSKIVLDKVHNKVFFSAEDPTLKKIRIYSIDASGNLATLAKIVETDYKISLHGLTFDISPETNTLFWCKREFDLSTLKNISTLTRTDLNGNNPKVIRVGTFINTVVVAKPVIKNG